MFPNKEDRTNDSDKEDSKDTSLLSSPSFPCSLDELPLPSSTLVESGSSTSRVEGCITPFPMAPGLPGSRVSSGPTTVDVLLEEEAAAMVAATEDTGEQADGGHSLGPR